MLSLCIGWYFFKGGNPAIICPPGLPSAESADFKSHWFSQTNGIQPLWFLNPKVIEICLLCVSSVVQGPHFSALSKCIAPSLLQAASLWHSDLPQLSYVASFLYLVMVFVLLVCGLLSGLLTWMWMVSSCKHEKGYTRGSPTPPPSQAPHDLVLFL